MYTFSRAARLGEKLSFILNLFQELIIFLYLNMLRYLLDASSYELWVKSYELQD